MRINTNQIIVLAFCVFAFYFSAIGQTNVSGFISTNTTWNFAGSPYIVTGNALVSHGTTLTIEPGVIVKFDSAKALQIDGELIAIGTKEKQIVFTSNQSSPSPGDWAKLHFPDTSVNAVFDTTGNYISGSILKYCDVLYGGGLGYGAIHIENSSPYFSHCNIINSSSGGLFADFSNSIIDSSLIKNCATGLIFNYYVKHSCKFTISTNTIENNGTGISLGAPGAPWGQCPPTKIRHNTFINNSNGAVVGTINNCTISENLFANNSGTSNGIIETSGGAGGSIIECNKFLNNQTGSTSVIHNSGSGGAGIIRNNIFEGNSSSTGASVYNCYGVPTFTNNIVKNNISPNGPCINIWSPISLTPTVFINYNDFINNTGTSTIKITASQPNSNTYNFLHLKFNNFLDSVPLTIYNDVPYGSANIYADSNYWGGASTSKIDSAIYDYFDAASQSVVYYSPILSSPVVIDTACFGTDTLSTVISNIAEPSLTPIIYPNPATSYFTVSYFNTIHSGIVQVYNLLGEKILETRHSTSKAEVKLPETSSGVYLVKLNNGEKWFVKKIVIQRY